MEKQLAKLKRSNTLSDMVAPPSSDFHLPADLTDANIPSNARALYELLEARRSIRKFKTTPVPRDVLERILSAGLQAPSGKNRQNWRFFVAEGSKRDEYVKLSQKTWLAIKDVLEKRLKPSLYAFTERFFYTLGEAPVVLLCYSYNDAEEHELTSLGSVYMAVENINLACFAEGLGCCTMGAPLEIKDEVNEFVGLADHPEKDQLHLVCGIAIGYPDHQPPKAPRQVAGRVIRL